MIAFLEDLALNSWPMIGLGVGGLIISACLAIQGKDCAPISRDAGLGIGCYVLSFALGTAYQSAPAGNYELAVLLWQLGMLALMALYAAVVAAQRENPAEPVPGMYLCFVALYAALGLWVNGGLPPLLEPIEQRRGYELFGFLLISALPWVVFLGVKPSDLFGHLVWIVVGVAEAYAAIEYLDCQILAPDTFNLAERWGVDVAKAACVREYGGLYPWAIEIVTSGLLACAMLLHFCRRKMVNK